MSAHFEHVTVAGERWDLIAWRYYGAVHLQTRIIAANRDLFRGPDGRVGPIPVRLPGGLVVKVPVLEAALDESLLPPLEARPARRRQRHMSEREAKWQLLYRGVDISGDLDPMTTAVTYTDKLHGEADEIEVDVEDSKGLWRGPWCPEPGDAIRLWFGWKGAPLMFAGNFELDEPEIAIARGGDTMTIRGLAAPITKALRTEKTVEYEGRSVEEIAREVASRAGLTVKGTFNDTRWRRKTQRRQRDLEFLVQLGEDTDHYVSVRGSEVQFTPVDAIDGAPAAAAFRPEHRDHCGFRGRFQSAETYARAEARHLHDEDKRLIEGEERDERVRTGDTLAIRERVEDERQAKLLAKSRLHKANRKHKGGTLTLVGRPDLVAGAVVELVDHGKWSGRYVVDSSRHTITRGPFSTVLELRAARPPGGTGGDDEGSETR